MPPIPSTQARKILFKLIDNIVRTNYPVIISKLRDDRSTQDMVVLISLVQYNNLKSNAKK
jgi:hypothetical protein